MSATSEVNAPLMSRGMLAVIVAQFFSAFGDNALLFATLAVLKNQFYPDWSQPVLQMLFVGTYILLAPFVGQMADSFAKGRVMMFANSLKLLGALVVCFGFDPFLGYTLVGVGAAAYSPAKYGILGEIVHGEKLVKANGLMEGSTIAAILLGSVAGGFLADWNLIAALAACALTYGIAVVANLFIPKLQAARAGQSWHFAAMLSNFSAACRALWHNAETRFSLLGTSLFWGAGVTLRFLLVLIGVMVVIFSVQHSLMSAYLLLMVIGALGGFFVVPLNALLQARGKRSVGSGNAIAVQNLGENSAMLVMLGLYTLAIKAGAPAVATGVGFGTLFALAIAVLWVWRPSKQV